jgi:host factor-I protein
MAAKSQSVQLVFLDHVQSRQIPVTVFLLNGGRLQGIVVGHDHFTIQLIAHGQAQTVYKQSISAISPLRPIDLWEDKPEKPASRPGRGPAGGARVIRRTTVGTR